MGKAVDTKIVYSDYQATLDNGSEIDSGRLDMYGVDKVQFSGYASASGLTMTIDSRAHENQTPLSTPVTYTDGPFYMFNVICRQRYMRFKWTNNTGSQVTNVSMEIKESFGSSDKLSVFPVGVNPSVFSQAALVQAIIRGQQPDGDYVAVPADGVAVDVDDTTVSTSTPLAGDATYQSGWVDTDGFKSIEIIIATDQQSATDGIVIDYTKDAQAATPTVDLSRTFTFNGDSVTRGDLELSIPPRLDGFRITYTNGSSAQSSFFLEANLKTDPVQPINVPIETTINRTANADLVRSVVTGQSTTGDYNNIQINNSGAMLTDDFLFAVTRGEVTGVEGKIAYGFNPNVSTSSDPEDCWGNGGLYTGQPIHSDSAETVEVFSSSANDTSAGTGARTVKIEGLDENWAQQTVTVTVNGTTAVTTSEQWRRVFYVEVLTVGSGGENAGNITVRHTTTTANIFAVVQTGDNNSVMAVFTVPASKTAYIKRLRVSMGRANGSAGSARVSLLTRQEGAPYLSTRYETITTSYPLQFDIKGAIVLEEKTDVLVRVESVSDNNSEVAGVVEYILVDD